MGNWQEKKKPASANEGATTASQRTITTTGIFPEPSKEMHWDRLRLELVPLPHKTDKQGGRANGFKGKFGKRTCGVEARPVSRGTDGEARETKKRRLLRRGPRTDPQEGRPLASKSKNPALGNDDP